MIPAREHWRGPQRCMNAKTENCMPHMTRFNARMKHASCVHRTTSIDDDASVRLRVAQVALREKCAKFFQLAKHFAFDFVGVHG